MHNKFFNTFDRRLTMGNQCWLIALTLALCTTTTVSSVPEQQFFEASGSLRILAPKESNKSAVIDSSTAGNLMATGKSHKYLGSLESKTLLTEDLRIIRILSETAAPKKDLNTTILSKTPDINDDYYNYDYDEDYSYDEMNSAETGKNAAEPLPGQKFKKKNTEGFVTASRSALVTTSTGTLASYAAQNIIGKLQRNKGNLNSDSNLEHTLVDDILDEDDEEESNKADASNAYNDNITAEGEIEFNENIPCPRDCICARNANSYLVASCSILDLDKQKFGSDITDLVVVDVGPKYPILLGPNFFVKIGLKHVSSIKISNCTIENFHQAAFRGLDDLFSVNLTNVGLSIIDPFAFSNNKKLRMLTISGNDLSIMSSLNFILKSSSVEELDLSRNNLMQIDPHAFSTLSNIVYINLASNNLQTLPDTLFDSVETIEELDLSFNKLKTIPSFIFNRTSLSILHLKYNEITDDLRFGTADLQHLDLSFCSIKALNHHMFDKMEGLTNLNLRGNGITKIQTDSFLTLKSLRHIDLSINELDQLSSLIFYKNSELDVIRLNDNPRLSQLPTDGFESSTGTFNVYLLDISNCAIGALGRNMFSTMPNLATLKLAWNNINNLERDTFTSLTKLTELDLSNNLIVKLDEMIFQRNNNIAKLNLAGNPIRKLTANLFLPFENLNELDVSECELHSLITESTSRGGLKYKFYDTLRTLNASANQIRKVSVSWLKQFRNLRTLDISSNLLKCNEEFQDFINYVSFSTKIAPTKVPTLANLQGAGFTEFQPYIGWSELSRQICKHHHLQTSVSANIIDNEGTILRTNTIEAAQGDLEADSKKPIDLISNGKVYTLQRNLKDSDKNKESNNESLFTHFDKKITLDDEGHLNKANDGNSDEIKSDYDYDEENDEEDDEYEQSDKKKLDNIILSSFPRFTNERTTAEEVNLSKETQDKFLINKFLLNGDDEADSRNEEIIIEGGRVYRSEYMFLIPVVIILSCIVVLLLVVAKIVLSTIRKRGERYRMALLGSKNSIVYQKLSEEITPQLKKLKHPKIHRYSPINQV